MSPGPGSVAPRLSVSLGLWQDRPAAEVVRTAEVADALGYGEIWIGEMATFDAFALGAVVAERTARAALTIGPLAVAVRDPVMIAMGAGSLAELTGRTVNVALGSSSPVVVEQWHGRRQERTALALAESATAVRALLAGGKADVRGEVISTRGFRLRTRAPGTPLTIAAFGRGAVRVAARQADRMVINLVTPKSAARLVQMLHDECRAAGRPVPPVAAWLAAVVDPSATRESSSCAGGWSPTCPRPATARCSPRPGSATWCASPGRGRIRVSCWPRSRPRSSATSRWPATAGGAGQAGRIR